MEEVADTSEMQPNVFLFGRTIAKGVSSKYISEKTPRKSSRRNKFASGTSYSDPYFVIATFQSILVLQCSSMKCLLGLQDEMAILEVQIKDLWLNYINALDKSSFFNTNTSPEEMKQLRKAIGFSIQMLLVIILFGCWKSNLSILGHDMVQWISMGKIPYFNAFNMLPKEFRSSHLLHSSYHLVFLPTVLPTAKDLENGVFQLCTFLSNGKLFTCPLSAHLISLGIKLSLPGRPRGICDLPSSSGSACRDFAR